ncbi:MAG: HAMP domain-containing sensor histidine kinase [Polyangiales bacterium]
MTPGRTFAGRVARAMALTAALAAAATAALTDQLSWRWTLAREDDRLRAALATFAVELGPSPTPSRAREVADDEDRETRPAGLRVAISGAARGGAEGLLPGAAGCEDLAWRGARWRRCTAAHAGWTLVAASPTSPLWATRTTWLLASAAAVGLAALAALAASRAVSTRIVGPLARLRARVDAVSAASPDASALGPREGYDEVDALRGAMAELLARHAEALTQARRFAADAAHELRTPLSRARAEVELAAEEEVPPAVSASLARVSATLAAVTTLTERLLLLAAPIDPGGFAREAVSLADVARDAVDDLPSGARARVVTELDDEGLVRGEPTLLRALVDNLIDNALKFAPEGEVRVSVQTGATAVELGVRDEGPGIPAEERGRVFEAFHRAASARARRGARARAWASRWWRTSPARTGKGRVEETDRGASVRVTLPRW